MFSVNAKQEVVDTRDSQKDSFKVLDFCDFAVRWVVGTPCWLMHLHGEFLL